MKLVSLAVAGWLIPGGAFLLQRRFVHFAIFALLVCLTFAMGVALQGTASWPQPAELTGLGGFDTLVALAGSVTKLLAGMPYFVARWLGGGAPWLGGALHEYGSTLLTLAGLFNLLAIASALEPASAETR